MAFVLLVIVSAAACGPKGEDPSKPTPPSGAADDAGMAAAPAIDAGVPDARPLPDSPPQSEVDAVMHEREARMRACNKSGFSGTIVVILDVYPYGEVERVQIKGAPDTSLAECIARAAQRATFGRSKNGGRVSYELAF